MTILADDLFHGTLDTSLSGARVEGKEANRPSPEGLVCLPWRLAYRTPYSCQEPFAA